MYEEGPAQDGRNTFELPLRKEPSTISDTVRRASKRRPKTTALDANGEAAPKLDMNNKLIDPRKE